MAGGAQNRGPGLDTALREAYPSLDGFPAWFAGPVTLSPEDQKIPGSSGTASPPGAKALVPETQANCLENQPVTFKGGSGQGQHQIPAVPPSAHRHTAPKLRLNTSTFLDSFLFPGVNI